MIRELFPLEGLVVIDVDLPEQLDELLNKLGAVAILGPEVVEHDLEELL